MADPPIVKVWSGSTNAPGLPVTVLILRDASSDACTIVDPPILAAITPRPDGRARKSCQR
jgi:hypothetical protein